MVIFLRSFINSKRKTNTVKKKRFNKKGFTLVEIIVVIFILAFLAAIVFMSLNEY